MTRDPAGQDLRAAARLLGDRRIAVLTGAGVSAESGVPTFRGEGGFWEGRSAMELATPRAFDRDPETVWAFYRHRLDALAVVRPNPAHVALAALEQDCDRFWLITQNVDGLHRAAGSRNVIELHGTLFEARCRSCDHRCPASTLPEAAVPPCPACGDVLRPAVVWFGEMLPARAVARAEEASRACGVMLVVGTSGLVQPAASLSARARAAGARIVEVNPEATLVSDMADISLRGPAGEILPRLLALRG